MHLTRIVLYDIRMVQEEQDQKRVQPRIKVTKKICWLFSKLVKEIVLEALWSH